MGRSQSKVDESCLEEDAQLRGNGGGGAAVGWGCHEMWYGIDSRTSQ